MIISLVSMIITLVFAYVLDYWHFLLVKDLSQTGITGRFMPGEILAGILLCAVWLALGWLILIRSYRSTATSIIYILIGLLAFAWSPLQVAGPVVYSNLSPYIFLFPAQPINFQYSGLFIAILGGLGLFLPNKYNP